MAATVADGSTLFLRDAEHTSSLDWEDPWRIFGTPFPKSEAEATARLQTWVDRNAKKGANMTPAQRLEVDMVLCRNAALFREELGSVSSHKHVIKTDDEEPIRARPIRQSLAEREYIRRSVEKMLAEGVVQVSDSAWSSPVVLVEKGDGTIRFAIDYRNLNKKTPLDKSPIGTTQDVLDALANAEWFSCLDARSGFHQQEIDAASRHKTAFLTADGLYEWTRLPMGLNNAPASFTKMMVAILHGLCWEKCLVYLDDILLFTKKGEFSFEQHMKDLDELCNRLMGSGITMKLSKCTFATSELIRLGHRITRDGVSPDPAKLTAIAALLPPTTKTDVRAFLGMVGYYRRFIKDFAKLSAPLEKLLEGTAKGSITLTDEQRMSWDTLRLALTSDSVLAFPQFEPTKVDDVETPCPPFVVKTDASDTQIGAVLMQKDRPVAFFSRKLRGAELNWHTTEKECFAVVQAVKRW
jgi:hypothetical protein